MLEHALDTCRHTVVMYRSSCRAYSQMISCLAFVSSCQAPGCHNWICSCGRAMCPVCRLQSTNKRKARLHGSATELPTMDQSQGIRHRATRFTFELTSSACISFSVNVPKKTNSATVSEHHGLKPTRYGPKRIAPISLCQDGSFFFLEITITGGYWHAVATELLWNRIH